MNALFLDVFLSSLHAVPEGPPLNIQYAMQGPDSVNFSWAPPLEELRNGVIAGYRVFCSDVGRERDPITVTVGEHSTVVSGFMSATRYNCSLAARTSAGFGVNDTLLVLTSRYKALCAYS